MRLVRTPAVVASAAPRVAAMTAAARGVLAGKRHRLLAVSTSKAFGAAAGVIQHRDVSAVRRGVMAGAWEKQVLSARGVQARRKALRIRPKKRYGGA
jgi:hypothetical protein